MEKLRELIRQAIEQVLDEENATSGGEAYMTKFAFSKGGKNKATKYAEKLGMKVVGDRPKHGKTFDFIKYEFSGIILGKINGSKGCNINQSKRWLWKNDTGNEFGWRYW